MPALPYGPRSERTPAEWAQLHSGIEFIAPSWERDAMIFKSQGMLMWEIASITGHTEAEVERALGRVARTLTSWERNACKWATRYVAREPWAADSAEGRSSAIADATPARRSRRPMAGRSL